jgi:hypothetical protein
MPEQADSTGKKKNAPKSITHGDINNIVKKLVKAPNAPQDEQYIKSKAELLEALKLGIVAYLKKGYSVKAAVDFINTELTFYKVTEAEIKKYLPLVAEPTTNETNKKESRSKKSSADEKNDETDMQEKSEPESHENDERSENIIAEFRHDIIYLENTFNDKEEIKKLGGKYDPDRKRWHIPDGIDPNEFAKWIPKT